MSNPNRPTRFVTLDGPGTYAVAWKGSDETLGIVERITASRWSARVTGGERAVHGSRAAAHDWIVDHFRSAAAPAPSNAGPADLAAMLPSAAPEPPRLVAPVAEGTVGFLRAPEFTTRVCRADELATGDLVVRIVAVTGAVWTGRATFRSATDLGPNRVLHLTPGPQILVNHDAEVAVEGRRSASPAKAPVELARPATAEPVEAAPVLVPADELRELLDELLVVENSAANEARRASGREARGYALGRSDAYRDAAERLRAVLRNSAAL